jgi:hypothetical protein
LEFVAYPPCHARHHVVAIRERIFTLKFSHDRRKSVRAERIAAGTLIARLRNSIRTCDENVSAPETHVTIV